MGKIVINLNPQKEKASGEFLQKVIAYTPLAVLSAGIVLTLILFLQIVILKKAHTHKVYDRKWAGWEDRANLIRNIKNEISNSENEGERLKTLTAPKYEMALILGDIFSSLPKNVWFESLDFKEEVINLQGYVVKRQEDYQEDYLVYLDNFIGSLREKNYFSSKFAKANINQSKKENFKGVEVLKFIIECKN